MKKLLLLLLLAVFLPVLSAKIRTIQISPDKTEYEITVKKSGNYWLYAKSKSRIPVGEQHFVQLRLDDGFLLTRRLLAYNRTEADCEMERLVLKAGVKHRLYFKYDDKRTEVFNIRIIPERPYSVPKEARNYKPKFIPPKHHPRLFVNPEFLTELKKNIELGDSLPVWQKVSKTAVTPYNFVISKDKEVSYDANLLAAVEAKAFYYLVKGDKKIGKEAIELIKTYIRSASFGNGQDICRRVGEMIYCASLVYDWCYDLLSAEEKTLFRKRMLFYAAELEAAWPPFRQYASAGHGNEAQFNRDLLSMALAIYDEDPLPYSYVAWQIFEVWLPLKQNTYLSGRHSQGSSYGQYRAQYDFIAALQIWRVFGKKVLPEEVKDFPLYWYYLRLPDGVFLIEGDDNWKITRPQYVPISPILLNCLMALYPNPDYKMELIRGKKLSKPFSPVLFLLANDPKVKPQDTRAKLPLSRLYKNPLPGLAIRTGWNFSPASDDMVLTINGGNRHLINHQHADLGSFQLHYRAELLTDLGQYRIYNVPYDRMLNKTSALHSLMRFVDPDAKAPPREKDWMNTGSQFLHGDRPPLTLKSFLTDSNFYRGETPRAGFGPSAQKPDYNFLETDLTPAYRGRVSKYNRSFVFWNQNDKNRPGTLLILDRFATIKENIKPIFQLTTVTKPVVKDGKVILSGKSPVGKIGSVTIQSEIPAGTDIKVLTGKASRTFGGKYMPARWEDRREAHGSRIEITGKGNVYLHVLQIHDGNLTTLPVETTVSGSRIQSVIDDAKSPCLTNFGEVNSITKTSFKVTVRKDNTKALLLDLAPGKWNAVCGNKKFTFNVTEKEGCIYGVFNRGTWQISPVTK